MSNAASSLIRQLVSKEVRELSAYHVPSPNGMVKLDAMENPYQLEHGLRQQWADCLLEVEINRYPDPGCADLKHALRQCFSIPEGVELLLGNGSDELIQLLAILIGGKGRNFMSPMPSFSMYQQICIATNTGFVLVPLQDDYTLDADLLVSKIKKYQPACLFLAYPNNPTGNCFEYETIVRAIRNAPGLVVVDEAYYAFCQKSLVEEIVANPNLVVLRTMSKSGLAGLRLGLMMADPQWIEQLEKLRLPYNINSLTQASANFYLKHHSILASQCKSIVRNRAWVVAQLEQIPEIRVFPSEANFVLIKTLKKGNAFLLFQALKEKGVLVKNLHQPETALQDCLRVTISSEVENKICIDALTAAIDQLPA